MSRSSRARVAVLRALALALVCAPVTGCELVVRLAAAPIGAAVDPPPRFPNRAPAVSGWGELAEVGALPNGNAYPSGRLAWVPRTLYAVDRTSRGAWLILNPDTPSEDDKVASYGLRVAADCVSRGLAVGYLMKFSGRDGTGTEISSQRVWPEQPIAPSDMMASLASSAICAAQGGWPAPKEKGRESGPSI